MSARLGPLRGLHASLVLVWLGTAVASLLERNGQSRALLADAGVHGAAVQTVLIVAGALADAAVGLALWRWPGRASYGAALALMALMTVVATALQPALWLHPLGPLLKNLPIAAALVLLMRAGAAPAPPAREEAPA